MFVQQLPSRESLNCYLKPGSIGCEIGVAKGDHAASLLKSNPQELHLVDYWDKNHPHASKNASYSQVAKRFDSFIKKKQVVIHHGDAFEIMPKFPHNFLDWIYIDAWHEYEDISRQISLALPIVKQGGIIAGHDFEVVPATHGTGVVRAVLEFVQTKKILILAITNEKTPDWISVKL